MPHALIVDDDPNSLDALEELVRAEGFSTSKASSLNEARRHLERQGPDLVLTDLVLPDGSGIDLLREANAPAGMQVVLVTGHASVDSAVLALRAGATDYLVKPIDIVRLKSILTNVQRTLDLAGEITRLREDLRDLGRFGVMVGASPAMRRLYEMAAKVAPTNASVLITGESGTGKELLAETLHAMSRRRKGPLVAVNCGAISPHLIESELFGHERGSFTGAERRHRGYFERASGGTLFLDEITEMPIELQVKLLRVLETSSWQRVGGESAVAVDVRVVAATNRSPEQAVADGRLRRDLLFRLRVFSLHIPPLRERGHDVELLAEHFVRELNRRAGQEKTIDPAVLTRLTGYSWPGNVRELRNAVEHAFILAGDRITADCLPPELATAVFVEETVPSAGHALRSGDPTEVSVPVGRSLAEVERDLILRTLESFGGDKKRAAETLGVSLKTLYNRLHAYRRGHEAREE